MENSLFSGVQASPSNSGQCDITDSNIRFLKHLYPQNHTRSNLGDVSNLPDGRVAGENQRLPDGDRAYRPQLNQLERDSPRESVHATPAYTMHSDSIGVLRGRTDPRVNVQVS
ncbi:hypothetical protein OESDEN_15315 [Oesophagostomum dentatum]|uniref:Uncharacterized protein n=1 Tax=Oesophagostomum dentatum TaxID=61180 RepID=A0A0B1SP23_OESDE|nr:hypothetical protein OESDEN_15315 [Oesophagostomum dentatum]